MPWSDLNDAQYRAVTSKEHTILVLAGAGTGKTRTIIARASFLIESGVDPSRIAILSFTNKSAEEIVSRVGEDAIQGLRGMTFHSFCTDLITSMPEVFGMSGYTLMDEHEQFSCMKVACTNCNAANSARQFLEVASLCNNTFCSLDVALGRLTRLDATRGAAYVEAFEEQYKMYGKALAEYNGLKRERKLLDFDDTLAIVAETLRRDPEARKRVCSRFDHILIDEMQDTNPLQYRIIESFAKHCDIFCVGDDAQSIYGFRGADFKSIHSFAERFPNAVTYPLNLNYRSTQEILDLANLLLARSPLDYDKVLISQRGDGAAPQIISCSSFSEIEEMIASSIQEGHSRGLKWSDHMVLARARYKLHGVERRLLELGIPVRVIGSAGFMGQRHVRYITSPLRILANSHDIFAWNDYFDLTQWEYCRGAMVTTLKDYGAMIRSLSCEPSFEKALSALAAHKDATKDMIRPLQLICNLQSAPAEALRQIRAELDERLSIACPGHDSEHKRDFDLLQDIAASHASVKDFIAALALERGIGEDDGTDAVTLSTIHSAKGLEADSCYILDANEDEWPNKKSVDAGQDAIEEERRILYVAMTRAKNHLRLYRTEKKRLFTHKSFLEGLELCK